MSEETFETNCTDIEEAFNDGQEIRFELNDGSNREIVFYNAEALENSQPAIYKSLKDLYADSEPTLDEILESANLRPYPSKKTYVAVLVDKSNGEEKVHSAVVLTRNSQKGYAEDPCYEIFDIQADRIANLQTLTTGVLKAFERDTADINTLLVTIPLDSQHKDIFIKAFMMHLDGWEFENNSERVYMKRPVEFGYSYEKGIIYSTFIIKYIICLGSMMVNANYITQTNYTERTLEQITALTRALTHATYSGPSNSGRKGSFKLSPQLKAASNSVIKQAPYTTRNSIRFVANRKPNQP